MKNKIQIYRLSMSIFNFWAGKKALILKAWGRLDEAMALHKEEETICKELGNQSGFGLLLVE